MAETSEILEEIGTLQRRLNELKASMTQKLVQETIPKEYMQLFVCRVRNERIGLPINSVEEVLPVCKLSTFPEAPPWLTGLLNLRGSMIPVLDVLARIGHKRRDPELSDFIVICSHKGRRFGLIVQEVFNIREVHGSELQPVAHELPQAPYVLGLFKLERSVVFLLSLSCLLATSDLPEDLW